MKVIKHISPLFFFLFLHSFSVNAQNVIVDSLKQVLISQKEDTSKVNTLNRLSNAIRVAGDTANALQYAENALSLANKINFKNGKGEAYRNVSLVFVKQGNYTEAIQQNLMAVRVFEESGDKQGVARPYRRIISIYKELRNYAEALRNSYICLKLYEELGDKQAISDIYQLIAGIYYASDNYPEALKAGYQRLKLTEGSGDKRSIAEALQDIGAFYQAYGNNSEALNNWLSSLKIREEIGDSSGLAQSYACVGEIYSRQGKNMEALQMHFTALKIYQSPNMPFWGIAFSNTNIALVYERQGDSAFAAGNKKIATEKFIEAEKKFFAALNIYEKNRFTIAIADGNYKLGVIHIKLKNFQQAKDYLVKGLQLSASINSKSNLVEIYKGLSTLDSVEGNYKQAYDHYKMYVLYRDSLFNEESTKKSLQAKFQYESDKQDAITKAEQARKEAEQQRAKTIQYFAMGSLIVLVLIVLMIAWIQWRNNLHKKKANVLLQYQKEKAENTLTELRSTQNQLIQSEKMASLGELTAGIAHEIQNPLNFVNNFSDVNRELVDELQQELKAGKIEDAISISNDIKENEEKINHHGKRADSIVKGMLQHSRSSSGVKEPTDINALCDEYLRLAYHGLRAKDKSFNADIKTDFDNSIGNINIIPQDIGRVILNLINNAFYAVDEKKKLHPENYEPIVSVSTRTLKPPLGGLGAKVEISVKDNGNGIPQKVLDKIFQPFFTTKPTGQGTGLGLSLSYDIVKAHGGEIKVNTKENEGTEFMIILPG